MKVVLNSIKNILGFVDFLRYVSTLCGFS